MMKPLLFLTMALVYFDTCFSQTAAKSVYFELGGPGIASFNYDTRFTKKEDGIGGRIGIGGFSIDGETALFFPLQLSYLLGKDTRNYFEIGGGATIVSYNSDFFTDDGDGTFTNSFGHLYFGYRLQPLHGGFLFRAGITPVFGKGFFIPYYAGVSFGYKFGN